MTFCNFSSVTYPHIRPSLSSPSMSSPTVFSPAMSSPSMSSPPLFSPSISSPALSSPAMSTPAKSSVSVQSCNVHPCDVVRHCPVLQFQRSPSNMCTVTRRKIVKSKTIIDYLTRAYRVSWEAVALLLCLDTQN